MYEYPYGNSQQLNLDWILNKLKEFETSGASSADMKSIANALLSASYDSNSSYAVNDIIYNDTLETLYICNTVIPVGGEPWDATHWDAFRVGEVLTFLFNTIQNLSSDDVANDSNVTGTGLTAALNALVEDIRYNNHYLQQKKNGSYSNVIAIEDTPSNNSDRLASSKAAYDLKGAITSNTENTQKIIAPIITSLIATEQLTRDSFRIYNNTLYQITATVSQGETINSGNSKTLDLATLFKPTMGTCGFTSKVTSGSTDSRWFVSGFNVTGFCSFVLAEDVTTGDTIVTGFPTSMWSFELIGMVTTAASGHEDLKGKCFRFRKVWNTGELEPWYNSPSTIPAGTGFMVTFSYNIGG